MDRAKVIKALSEAAAATGFRHRAGLCWWHCDDFYLLADIQNSRWDDGKYINVGLTPADLVFQGVPPKHGWWGLQIRADEIPSIDTTVLDKLFEGGQEIDSKQLKDAMTEVLLWLNRTWTDSVAAKRLILDETTWFKNRCSIIVLDWAKGRLRSPAEYFEDSAYYGTKRPRRTRTPGGGATGG